MTRAEACRANGAKSRGPITPEGKGASRYNAVKHGYFAKTFMLLDSENRDEYYAILNDYMNIYKPRNTEEADLVLDIVNARWRIRRAEADYARLVEMQQHNPANKFEAEFDFLHPYERSARAADVLATTRPQTVLMLQRTENSCRRALHQAMKTLRDLQKLDADPDPNSEPYITPAPAPKPGPDESPNENPEPNPTPKKSSNEPNEPPTKAEQKPKLTLVPDTSHAQKPPQPPI